MQLLPFRPTLPRLNKISTVDDFFTLVKHLFPVYLDRGFFYESKTKALFVYQQKLAESVHTGIIAAVHLQDYLEGRIIKHEQTLSAKEEKMLSLFTERNGQVKPVLITYPSVAAINDFLCQKTILPPDWSVTYKDGEHNFWVISDEGQIEYLCDLFRANVPKSFIADGHHRAETMSKIYQITPPTDKSQTHLLLSAFFATNELYIGDYNRVVRLSDRTPLVFLAQLSEIADITPVEPDYKPLQKHELGMCLQNEWFSIRWKSAILNQITSLKDSLDVSLLNHYVLNQILKMEDVRSDARISYVDGSKGLKGMKEKMETASAEMVGFTLFPISTTDFMEIVEHEGVMPPKSTFFMPRIHNGFVTLLFE